ncbi:hypothetical protein [Pseudomonas sp. SO81]|nr:hypothetical protein [Pseudomonas sp. SO81]WJN61357.1 hypothetical protein OH686_21650 [Pseudomonas sp. SO81]
MRLKNVLTLTLFFCLASAMGMWGGYSLKSEPLPAAITFVPSCPPAI